MLKCKIFEGNCYSAAQEFNEYVESNNIQESQIVFLKYATTNRHDDRHSICLIYKEETTQTPMFDEEAIMRLLDDNVNRKPLEYLNHQVFH